MHAPVCVCVCMCVVVLVRVRAGLRLDAYAWVHVCEFMCVYVLGRVQVLLVRVHRRVLNFIMSLKSRIVHRIIASLVAF